MLFFLNAKNQTHRHLTSHDAAKIKYSYCNISVSHSKSHTHRGTQIVNVSQIDERVDSMYKSKQKENEKTKFSEPFIYVVKIINVCLFVGFNQSEKKFVINKSKLVVYFVSSILFRIKWLTLLNNE